MAVRDTSFALPAHKLAGAGLAPPHVAAYPTGGQGLRLDETGQIPSGLVTVGPLDYSEFTGTVTVATTNTEAAPKTVVSSTTSLTFDGASYVLVEFFAPTVTIPSGSNFMTLSLRDTTNSIDYGRMSRIGTSGNTSFWYAQRRVILPSGTYTISAVAWSSAATGSGTIVAGAGGAATYCPGFLRVTTDS